MTEENAIDTAELNSKQLATLLFEKVTKAVPEKVELLLDVEKAFMLIYAATKGGKIFGWEIYWEMANKSLTRGDRDVAAEYGCDMLAVQNARRNFIDSMQFVLSRIGVEVEIFGFQENGLRIANVFQHRNVAVAERLVGETFPPGTTPLRTLFKYYAEHGTVYFYFIDFGVTLDEPQCQYYDRAMRCFLAGGSWKGFPRLAQRVLFLELIRRNNEHDMMQVFLLATHVLRSRFGYQEPLYYKWAKISQFFRRMMELEYARMRRANMQDVDVVTYFPMTEDAVLDTLRFYQIGMEHVVLPESLRNLFEHLANGGDVKAAAIPNLTTSAATSGIRLIKAALMTGRRIENADDVFALMGFDPDEPLKALQRKAVNLISM